MSAEVVARLIVAFDHASQLNQEAVNALAQGATIESLAGLFERKAAALTEIEAATLALSGLACDGTPAMAEAVQAQTRAARLEALLAEDLVGRREAQKNVNGVTKAYLSPAVDKLGIKGVDLAS